MRILYNISIYLYLIVIHIASLSNNKARLWIKGRRGIWGKLNENLFSDEKVIWIHAASLGEFEQGRPIIEEIRKSHPDYKILLTFFSPSGYEVRKNYDGADYIYYLPIDTYKNANRFVEIVEPELVFFIKYEFWYNYLHVLYQKEIPVYFVSAIFRKNHYFFRKSGKWFRRMLQKATWIFVQNNESLALLLNAGINNSSVSGDTRFDRVWNVSRQKKQFLLVENFKGNDKVLLAGSSWPPDEEMLVSFINDNAGKYKFIIAPHEIKKEKIDKLVQDIKAETVKYSEIDNKNSTTASVLIIDCIGILLHLYAYCTVAYIGGGFGKSIHNILEAATYGKPVVFGPKYHKFQEAVDLINLGGAYCVNNYDEFERIISGLFESEVKYNSSSSACSVYVEKQLGATEHILNKVFLRPVIR